MVGMSEPDVVTAEVLRRLRSDPASWQALCFTPVEEDDDTVDVNAERRGSVLTAILFDPQPTDRALLRFLLEQDIREHEESWGLSDRLRLSMLLLAEHRCVDDAWLQWRAKTANFDTETGLYAWPVLAGGVDAVRSMVEASGHPEREELLEYLSEAPYAGATDDDVEEWLLHQRTGYFEGPELDSLKMPFSPA
jgi:hypothetical protein